ncbi:TetR/AcrR family transcriptional regulator [Streptomyces sp. NPDC002262]|uniref:TetR/AcrR family transcriptional regulator n=1 Tax=unclassified Streptomyces TaxID=2593676 RepID=UPI00332202F7
MSIQERREREFRRRSQLILDAARTLAEAEGWGAVTTRRIAEEIEYSQPVLYSHYQGREAIISAVALQGFERLSGILREARTRTAEPAAALRHVVDAYLDLARTEPALYSAMFELSSPLSFASEDTPPALVETFAEVISAVAALPGKRDVELTAEFIWGALHGMVLLARDKRLRPGLEEQRVELLMECVIPPEAH